MSKALFVTIEGIDATGKRTQADLLAERHHASFEGMLPGKKPTSSVVSFPQYDRTFFGSLVRQYLNGDFGNISQNHPLLTSLLYAADRWESRELLEYMLNQPGLLVADRFVDSNLAHQAAKLADRDQADLIGLISHMEYHVFKTTAPDASFLLDLPVSIAAQRVAKERAEEGAEPDIHEADLPYLASVAKVYYKLASGLSNASPQPWHVIPCVSENQGPYTAELISDKIWAIVEPMLEKHANSCRSQDELRDAQAGDHE